MQAFELANRITESCMPHMVRLSIHMNIIASVKLSSSDGPFVRVSSEGMW